MKTSKDAISQPKILVYQDENCDVMVDYLTFYGFDIITSNEDNIVSKIKDGGYDLCILSHYKSAIIGNLSLLKILRKTDKLTPVIMVSDLSKYQFIIEAYDEGADDYIIRPYNLEILVRKINLILKRYGIKTRIIQNTYQLGNYRFDVVNDTLTIDNTEIKLPAKETQLLALLCAYEGEVLQTSVIMQRLWRGENNYWNKRSLDVNICHLRNYLKMDKRISIVTKRALGYSLVINAE
nr:MAG TPA: response regulator [Caudoviricetes sp.]